jgi:hypothetical protein
MWNQMDMSKAAVLKHFQQRSILMLLHMLFLDEDRCRPLSEVERISSRAWSVVVPVWFCNHLVTTQRTIARPKGY